MTKLSIVINPKCADRSCGGSALAYQPTGCKLSYLVGWVL